MKILIICFYYPPFNVAGSLRLARISEHLVKLGHEIKVITGDHQVYDKSLDIPKGIEIKYLDSSGINSLPKKIFGGDKQTLKITQSKPEEHNFKQKLLFKLSRFYRNLTNIPDAHYLWQKRVLKSAEEIATSWKPDLIYASALPPSVAIAGSKTAKKLNVPWVCEFRDLWTQNHYYDFPKWRKKVDERIEKKHLEHALGLVTVSEPLKDDLNSRYPRIPVSVILNGSDDKLSELLNNDKNSKYEGADRNILNIVYTGSLYKGKRDPSLLFEAISELESQYSKRINVHFYGRDSGYFVQKIAKFYNLEDQVFLYGPIPYEESLIKQRKADLTLLLLWDNPLGRGVLTGKLFEYFSARRPILAFGSNQNAAIKLIMEKNAGWHCSNKEVTMNILKAALESKSKGDLKSLPKEINDGFTRWDQSKKLNQFIEELTASQIKTKA